MVKKLTKKQKLKNAIKLYFLHIAQKRYTQNKTSKIDDVLFIIVNKLNK